MTYDDLFTPKDGGWFEHVSDDCRTFLEGLADVVVERGVDPTWAAVKRRIEDEFPGDAPKTIVPIQRAVRELVATRG